MTIKLLLKMMRVVFTPSQEIVKVLVKIFVFRDVILVPTSQRLPHGRALVRTQLGCVLPVIAMCIDGETSYFDWLGESHSR